MAPILLIWIWTMIGVSSCGVDSASVYYKKSDCETDHECPEGYFCFLLSNTCVGCVDCGVYMRTTSWRHCAKEPAHCGKCLPGYEEEILAGGKTRDFCIKSAHVSDQSDMIHSAYNNVQTTISAHYFLVPGLLLFLVPTMFYAFYWKKRAQAGRLHHQHSSVPRDEPPPYCSTELTPASSVSDAVECVEESQSLVANITQTKESLTQAMPFRHADYEDEQENAYYNTEEESEAEAGEENDENRIGTGNLEIEDENTMPSNWTPARVFDSNHLESEQRAVVETEDQECCQPSNKRRRKEPEDPDTSDSNTPQQQQQQQQSINFFISNNIIIKKED